MRSHVQRDDVTGAEKSDVTKSSSFEEDKDAGATEKRAPVAGEVGEDGAGGGSFEDAVESQNTHDATAQEDDVIVTQYVPHFGLVAVDSEPESSDDEDGAPDMGADVDWSAADVMSPSPARRDVSSANTSAASEGGSGEAAARDEEEENIAQQWWWCTVL